MFEPRIINKMENLIQSRKEMAWIIIAYSLIGMFAMCVGAFKQDWFLIMSGIGIMFVVTWLFQDVMYYDIIYNLKDWNTGGLSKWRHRIKRTLKGLKQDSNI
jgi:hypothetical protein